MHALLSSGKWDCQILHSQGNTLHVSHPFEPTLWWSSKVEISFLRNWKSMVIQSSYTWNRTLSSIDVNCSTNKVSWRVNVLMMDSGPPLSPAGNVLSKEISWSFQTWAFKCSLVVIPDSSKVSWNDQEYYSFSLRVQMSNWHGKIPFYLRLDFDHMERKRDCTQEHCV